MNKTILITGVAGFLGCNLALKLLASRQTVLGVDDLCTGSQENLKLLQTYSNFKFIQANINVPLNLTASIKQIYNLACPASPQMYQKMPLHTLQTCSTGVLNLLQLAKTHSAKFLQTSTSEIYGDPETSPQPESYWGKVNPVGPRSCYDEGKRFAESLITNFAQQEKVDVKIVRIFNTYGPLMRSDDGRVVSNFIMQALQNTPLNVYGCGQQTRSLCFVSDLIDALIKTMVHNLPLPGPINLGNPQEVSILELAKLIVQLTKSSSSIQFLPLPQDDPGRRQPDVNLARNILDWQAETSLKSGLKKTIAYFRGSFA
jgi:UDP-glucuronate decarboxylase